jgi:hypothetical protein
VVSELRTAVITPTSPSVDSELITAARISPATWALIITLIVTISGWGWRTYANSTRNDKQDAQLEQKLDKEAADAKFEAIIQRLDDLREDVREIRSNQQDETARHHRPRRTEQ